MQCKTKNPMWSIIYQNKSNYSLNLNLVFELKVCFTTLMSSLKWFFCILWRTQLGPVLMSHLSKLIKFENQFKLLNIFSIISIDNSDYPILSGLIYNLPYQVPRKIEGSVEYCKINGQYILKLSTSPLNWKNYKSSRGKKGDWIF